MTFEKLFKQIDTLNRGIQLGKRGGAKPVINIETLEVYESATDFAKKHNVTVVSVVRSITLGSKTASCRLEYFDVWKDWDNREKEKHSKKNNIWFI